MSDLTLTQRLAKGEDATTSFVASAGKPAAIARLVCGFLNSETGGVVFVGVDAQGRPLKGMPTAEQGRALEAALQKKITPSALFSVSADPVKDKGVLTIDVPPGSDRPYVVGGSVWVREKMTTKPAEARHIRAIFAGAEQAGLRWERRISTAMLEADVDLMLVRLVREKAEAAGRFAPEDAGDDLGMLRELSFVRAKGYTNACDVVFGKKPSRRLPQTRVQLLEFLTEKTDDTYKDFRWFEGPAIEIVEQVYKALQSHNRTQARFREGALDREERQAYHDFPLREGIVNALAHRSYESYSGGVKISIYPDRIEFWNTGKLPPEIAIKDLPRKHQSYPINPDIAHVFYLNAFMERTGRGTERIAEACKQIGAPPPLWVQTDGGVTLTVYSAFGAQVAGVSLNPRQRAFLDKVGPGEAISLTGYVESFANSVSERQARRDLTELERYRMVRKEGRSVATLYRRLKD